MSDLSFPDIAKKYNRKFDVKILQNGDLKSIVQKMLGPDLLKIVYEKNPTLAEKYNNSLDPKIANEKDIQKYGEQIQVLNIYLFRKYKYDPDLLIQKLQKEYNIPDDHPYMLKQIKKLNSN